MLANRWSNMLFYLERPSKLSLSFIFSAAEQSEIITIFQMSLFLQQLIS